VSSYPPIYLQMTTSGREGRMCCIRSLHPKTSHPMVVPRPPAEGVDHAAEVPPYVLTMRGWYAAPQHSGWGAAGPKQPT